MIESSESLNPSQARAMRRRAAWFPALRRKTIASVCAFSLMLQQAACYNAIPVAGAPTGPGRSGLVTLKINERGRLLVGKELGTLIDNVTGRIVASDSVKIEMAVETAEDVRGKIARWGGEKFTIPREGIESMTGKKLSRWRTFALIGGIALGLILGAIAAGSSSFSGDDDPGEVPPPI